MTIAPTAVTRRCGARLSSGPDGVIREVLDSKLMGRGGAAFPTGRKWEAVARQPRRPHYLICNADESEPGTFKDRVIMEGDPFSVIESMTIAAYATGCEHGYIYLRGEYPLAQRRLEHALEQARERELLGEDILGPRRALRHRAAQGRRRLHLRRGDRDLRLDRGLSRRAAQQAAVPGRAGPVRQAHGRQQRRDARQRAPDPARRRRSVRARSAPSARPGPKLFCVCRSRRSSPGTYEVPFGTTLRELLELAGGVAAGPTPARRAAGRRGGQLHHPGAARSAADVRGRPSRRAPRSDPASWWRSTSTSTSASC